MKNFNDIINEAKDRLSKDFEVGNHALAKQTKGWLKALDNAMDKYGLTYDQCRSAAKKFKLGDFEGALKTIWGKKLHIDIKNSENGGSIKDVIYTIDSYGEFKEHIEYKNNSFIHTITGKYDNCSTPGYSLGTIITVAGKGDTSSIEVTADKLACEAFSKRNTANIYNILFVGIDIPSKIISKPMLRLKNSL